MGGKEKQTIFIKISIHVYKCVECPWRNIENLETQVAWQKTGLTAGIVLSNITAI